MVAYNVPVLTIPNATPLESDAAQYMIYKGVKQYNLCGQFCVAYCMRFRAATDNIDDYFNIWEITSLKWWQTIFKNRLARTTGIYDLEMMLKPYGATTRKWSEVPVKPEYFKDMLIRHQVIAGVKIDHTGYLVGGGIPHWVVLDGIEIVDKNHSILDIYNPYTNLVEKYSWREFMTSTGSYKQGIWVAR